MKLLIDECVSHQVCGPLEPDGHDVVHVVRDANMAGAVDADVLALARRQDRIAITADTDLPTLLAAGGADNRLALSRGR